MRANVGVNPLYLSDSHLIAEYRELKMPYGSLRVHNDFGKKGNLIIPEKFPSKEGHINFFKNKFGYLVKRYQEIVKEMDRRKFKCDLPYPDLTVLSENFLKNWIPSKEDSQIIRDRIYQRLFEKPWLYRYERQYICEDVSGNEKDGWVVNNLKPMEIFANKIMNSELYPV